MEFLGSRYKCPVIIIIIVIIREGTCMSIFYIFCQALAFESELIECGVLRLAIQVSSHHHHHHHHHHYQRGYMYVEMLLLLSGPYLCIREGTCMLKCYFVCRALTFVSERVHVCQHFTYFVRPLHLYQRGYMYVNTLHLLSGPCICIREGTCMSKYHFSWNCPPTLV